jgi:hypothetical protein
LIVYSEEINGREWRGHPIDIDIKMEEAVLKDCFVVFGGSIATAPQCPHHAVLLCVDGKLHVFAEEEGFLELYCEVVYGAYRMAEVVRKALARVGFHEGVVRGVSCRRTLNVAMAPDGKPS